MYELSLEQRTAAREICPECVDMYERIDVDVNKFESNQYGFKQINYSKLLRVVGLSAFPIVATYYLSSKFSPQIIEYIQSNF